MKLACNYAVIQFLPYPETGEFVNVGVVLACSPAGYLDFAVARRRMRVNQFFPELNSEIYMAGLHCLKEELLFHRSVQDEVHGHLIFPELRASFLEKFRNVVRPRESLFRFSEIKTTLADDPKSALKHAMEHYVERQFARAKEYQETIMTNRLRGLFETHGLSNVYQSAPLGNETYQVKFPLVQMDGANALKAIKPLDLDKSDSTKILEHGDAWINRIQRLEKIGQLPGQILFAVRAPEGDGQRRDAARDIIDQLQKLDAEVTSIKDESRVLQFASAARELSPAL